MGNVNSDVLAGLRTNFQAIFNKALGDNASMLTDVTKIATEIPSSSEKESLNWFGITPSLTEWKDKRQMNGLLPYTYTLTNRDWANGLEVDRDAILDDKLSMLPPRIRSMTKAYYRAVIREVFSLLDKGASTKAYDGGNMFATSRTIAKSGTINNYLSGNYSDSETEVRQAISDGVAAMTSFCDDWGEPLNLMPDTIVCSPAMTLTIQQALRPGVAGVIRPEAQVVNPNNVITSPWLKTTAKDWFLLCTSEEIKPVVFVNRQAPQFASLDNITDHDAFMMKKYYYGCDARFVTGFGDPRTAVMFHNT